MSEDKATNVGAVVKTSVDRSTWFCARGHTEQALSKRLIGPSDGSSKVGYVISTYAPGHYALPHKHKVREQIYHVLQGEGVMVIDGARHAVRQNDVVFLPPGVEHGMYNEGNADLVFVIASGPAEE